LINGWLVWKQPNGIWCALAEDDDSELPPLFGESLQGMRWLIARWEQALAISAARAAASAAKSNSSLACKAARLDDLLDQLQGTVEDPAAEQERRHRLQQQRIAAAAEVEEQRRQEQYERASRSRYRSLNALIDQELAKVRSGVAAA
jgi:exonuclease VII large subunit